MGIKRRNLRSGGNLAHLVYQGNRFFFLVDCLASASNLPDTWRSFTSAQSSFHSSAPLILYPSFAAGPETLGPITSSHPLSHVPDDSFHVSSQYTFPRFDLSQNQGSKTFRSTPRSKLTLESRTSRHRFPTVPGVSTPSKPTLLNR